MAIWIKRMLFVALGGSLGALSRYAMGLLALKLFGTGFPWPTLIVNLSGCFLIGLSFALAERRGLMSGSVWLFFVTGFLGALTTFSAFALETATSMQQGLHMVTALNLLSNNLLGVILVFLGMETGRTK
jgi:CrcB protein